jgi:hypothetical protein
MRWLRRYAQPSRFGEPDYTAIPLTPNDVALLAELVHQASEAIMAARSDLFSIAQRRIQFAKRLMRNAGVAAALGQQFVPLPVGELGELDHAIDDFLMYQRRVPEQFSALMARLHVLVGMAKVHGWTARYEYTGAGPGSLRWDQEPTSDQYTESQRHIGGSDATS